MPFMNNQQDMPPTGLSDEELEQMGRMTGVGKDKGKNKKFPKDKTISSDENETVTLVRHNEIIGEYKDKIEKLNSKMEEGRKTIQTLRDEKATAENKVEKLKQQCAELQASADEKQARLNENADEINRLKKEKTQLEKDVDNAAQDAQKDLMKDLEASQKRIDALQDDKLALEQRIRELETQIGVLRADKDELNAKLEEFSSAQFQRIPEQPDIVGTIIRTGPISFTSTLFISPRYFVGAAKTGAYLSFDPNIQGNIECIDHTLSVPGLDKLFPYRGTTNHSVVKKGSKLLIYLQFGTQ